jgi:formiminotetrahydrofolate cyclodeaminase
MTAEVPIGEFAAQLAARSSTPGGGTAAAVQLAFAGALVAMVGRFSDGPAYAEHAEVMAGIEADADDLRARALRLAEADADAFAAVLAAYRLDKSDPGRAGAIDDALLAAALVPADVIATAAQVLALTERLLPVGNRNVITDAAAAAAATHAAIVTSRVNIEANLAAMRSAAGRDRLAAVLAGVDDLLVRADRVTAAVRNGVAR